MGEFQIRILVSVSASLPPALHDLLSRCPPVALANSLVKTGPQHAAMDLKNCFFLKLGENYFIGTFRFLNRCSIFLYWHFIVCAHHEDGSVTVTQAGVWVDISSRLLIRTTQAFARVVGLLVGGWSERFESGFRGGCDGIVSRADWGTTLHWAEWTLRRPLSAAPWKLGNKGVVGQ